MSVRATPLTMIWKTPAIRISSPAILINSIYFDFLWIGEIRGNYLMNSLGDGRKITVVGMDWTPNSDPTSNIIPESTNAIFHLDHDTDFILDDCTDYLWFNYSIESQRDVTHAELIANNYRTLVKYSNTAPFNITAIGILKSTVILTQPIIDEITSDFWLWVFWSQYWNDYGYLKDNRDMINVNIVAIGSGTLVRKVPKPTGLILTLISGGVKIDFTDNTGGVAQHEIWAQSNGGVSTLLTTKNAGVVTHNDILTSVDLRYYKVRAKNGTEYSDFTAELSIAMLSAEMVDQSAWYTSAYWNNNFSACFSQVATHLVCNGTGGFIQRNTFWTGGKTYIVSLTYTVVSSGFMPPFDNAVNPPGGWRIASASESYSYTPTGVGLRIESAAWDGTLTALSIKENLAV
jgi:hypothetical protein